MVGSSRALILVRDAIASAYIADLSSGMGIAPNPVSSSDSVNLDTWGFRPDIAVIELRPTFGPSTLDLLVRARSTQKKRIPAVILSDHRSPYLVQDNPPSLRDCSYLVKPDISTPDVIKAAIDRAVHGAPGIHHNDERGLPALTRNQAATLRLVATGLNNQQIADSRHRSRRAVELTIARLYNALGVDREHAVNSRVAATLMYHQSRVTVR